MTCEVLQSAILLRGPQFARITGYHVNEQESGLLARLFGFHYGNLAFAQVHPSLNDRQEHLSPGGGSYVARVGALFPPDS